MTVGRWWLVLGLVVLAVAGVFVHERRSDHGVVVSLTFDDGFASQITAAAILAAHGDHATFYINSARLGTPRRLTPSQVRTLAAEGHEIGGHTLDHVNLPRTKRVARVRQICHDRLALARLVGPDRLTSFAYPYGALGPQVERDVAACGYNSARTVGGLAIGDGDCGGCPATEARRPPDPYRVRSLPSFVDDTPLAMAQDQILRAEQDGGGWVPLVFHEVCDRCSKLAITPAHFRELIAWVHERGIPIRTVGEVVGGSSKPLVAPQTALTATPVTAALVDPRGDGGWRPDLRVLLLAAVGLLFGLPVATLAVLRAAGRW